ncbi:PepSY domain-containing protein [Methylobacterium sp. 77]|uniref:PepSY domain-containing protein n=1 Tax=Methylobacterium sp. 77 TaxID=1101192 RepID=UPI0003782753|nr:PepSY domain-containing protein [Methylobacterium sp. 77]
MRILLALLFIGLTVAAFATGPIRTLAEEKATTGTAEVAAPLHPVPPSESCLSPADLREAVADKRVIEPVAAIRAARTVILRAEIQRARLCRHEDGLAYLLTALRRDGQFVHVMVDATTGRVIGQ